MFLDAYKRNWLETEGYSFEDKMIDDLSVSYSSVRFAVAEAFFRYLYRKFITVSFVANKTESHGGRRGRGRGDRDEA